MKIFELTSLIIYNINMLFMLYYSIEMFIIISEQSIMCCPSYKIIDQAVVYCSIFTLFFCLLFGIEFIHFYKKRA